MTNSSQKLVQLDGLRAVAVLLVLLQHFIPQDHAILKLLTWGTIGVQLFFVLSGFLITRILLNARASIEAGKKTSWYSLWHFHMRRFLRIFPVFYVSCLLLALLNIGPMRETLMWHLTYLSNVYLVLRGEMHGTVTHFWSLAVEMHFYLLWPLVVLFAPRRYIFPAILGMVAFAPLYRFALGALHLSPIARIWLLMGNTDTLGMGSLLALLTVEKDKRQTLRRWICTYGVWAGAAGVLCIAVLRSLDCLPWGPEVFAMSSISAALFPGIVDRAAQGYTGLTGRILASPPVTHVGRISYGLYVIHPFVPELLDKAFAPTGIEIPESLAFRFVLYTAMSITLASLSWQFMERPLNDLKRLFPYGS